MGQINKEKNKGGRPKNCFWGHQAGKCNCGRPEAVTPDVVKKLEEAFAIGCTDIEACIYADISRATYYSWEKRNPEFIARKEELKDRPVMKARNTLVKALIDPHYAVEYLKRKKKKEFSERQEVTGPEGAPLYLPSEIIKKNDLSDSGTTSHRS